MTLYPWQTQAWADLASLHDRWPHALLIHGQAGIGETAFARHIAKALLCEAALPETRPCAHCVACNWFEQGNHPDFRGVVPESLAATLPGADTAELGAEADKADKSAEKGDGAKSKVPSKEIKIEQIRSLLTFCSIGAHRGGRRVVLLFPAETMNAAASNALLKTLEEPPEGIVFVMVTSQIERLLPTIISRCRQWPLATPAKAPAIAWLRAQGAAKPEAALAESGGAPLTALAASEQGDDANRRLVLTQLGAGARCDAFACGEALQKSAVPIVFAWVQRWLYDLLSVKLSGTVRYYPEQAEALARCAAATDALAITQMNQELARQRATENHPLNARLVFESLFSRYGELFTD